MLPPEGGPIARIYGWVVGARTIGAHELPLVLAYYVERLDAEGDENDERQESFVPYLAPSMWSGWTREPREARKRGVTELLLTYQLLTTLELDVAVAGEPMIVRVELFATTTKPRVYRARIWRRDMYRFRPCFPRDKRDQPAEESDESLFVEWGAIVDEGFDRFEADSPEAALRKVLTVLRQVVVAASWVS